MGSYSHNILPKQSCSTGSKPALLHGLPVVAGAAALAQVHKTAPAEGPSQIDSGQILQNRLSFMAS